MTATIDGADAFQLLKDINGRLLIQERNSYEIRTEINIICGLYYASLDSIEIPNVLDREPEPPFKKDKGGETTEPII